MPFSRLNYGKVWTSDKDFPIYEGSETKVRQDMQYHPDAVKQFINDVLLPELEGTGGAVKIGDEQEGNLAATLAAFVEHFDQNDEAIRNLAAGESPEAVRASQVSFTAEGWAEDTETGLWELRILQSQHKRLNEAFGFKLQSKVGESYLTNTWEVACTDVGYDPDTQDVVLTAENAYNGAITFFGV